MKGKNPFPLPSEIGQVPGAEGWESLYPYFTRFRPEDDQRFWFYNSMHFPEPMPAFDAISGEVPYTALGAFTARVFAFPTVLGIEHRILNGRVYITSHAVTDPDEIGRRLALFQERAGYYYQNWSKLYGEWKERLDGLLAEIKAIEVPKLPEFDDADLVTEARGIAQNHFVRVAFHRTVECYSKMWHHHFEFLMLGYGAYLVFFQFCKTGVSRDHRSDGRAHGRGHRRPDVPPRRRTEAARTASPSNSASTENSRKEAILQIFSRHSSNWASPAGNGLPSSTGRANRGSTFRPATVSITITAAGTTICRCRSRRCRATWR